MWGWPTGRTGWSRPRARSWASRPPVALAADGGGGDAPGPSLRGELDAAVDGDRDHRRRGPRLRALPGAGVGAHAQPGGRADAAGTAGGGGGRRGDEGGRDPSPGREQPGARLLV